jgi:hypothetical protein
MLMMQSTCSGFIQRYLCCKIIYIILSVVCLSNHLTCILIQALKRAELFGISGVTYSLTQVSFLFITKHYYDIVCDLKIFASPIECFYLRIWQLWTDSHPTDLILPRVIIDDI